MTYLSPIEKRLRRARHLRLLVLALVGLALCTLLDHPTFHALAPTEQHGGFTVVDKHRYEGEDWYRLLRVVGYGPTWLLAGAAFVLVDRRSERPAWTRGGLVAVSALGAGLVAELLKLVVARGRPIDGDVYMGWVWHAPFSGFAGVPNLGFPSSHTAVAFGGAVAATLLMRPVWPVLILLATGCGLTRLLAGAHWLSDVYAGALVGAVTAWALGARLGVVRRTLA